MQRIRKGDEVIVITGRDKGKRGTVLSRVDDRHVTVEGINVGQEAYSPEPDDGCYWRYRQQSYADRSIERHARESGHR